jgi:hypothetical protein
MCDDAPMVPKSSVGMALAAYRAWRRLPPKQRRLVLEQVRKHGPKAAAAAATLVKQARDGRAKP